MAFACRTADHRPFQATPYRGKRKTSPFFIVAQLLPSIAWCLTIAVLCVPMAANRAEAAKNPFPVPYGMETTVDFWCHVFGIWRTDQVAFHDIEHPGIVYQVLALPGPADSTYTTGQRHFIQAATKRLEGRLKQLAYKTGAGLSLNPPEKQLADQITRIAGQKAIAQAYQRVRTQRGLRERFLRGLEISGRYEATFRRIFREAGLPEDLAYLPHVESSFQAGARSSAGATGLWQFTRGTGKLFLTINAAVDERLDPVASAYGAAQYFKQAYEKLGTWPLAVTAYNYGLGGMQEAKEQFGTDFARIVRDYQGRAFGFASRNFYAEFLAVRYICHHTKVYFPHGVRYDRPLNFKHLVLKRPMPAWHIARYYGYKLSRLCEINPAWSARARRGRIHIPKGTRVWLPAGATHAEAMAPSVFKPMARASLHRSHRVHKARVHGRHLVHVVRRHETLYGLAARYRLSVASLKRFNGISRRDNLIHPGQRLRIPVSASHSS